MVKRRPTPKPRFGQHFLIEHSIVDRIVEAACLSDGDTVLEIGPGTGVLTGALSETGASVVAVEIDAGLASELRTRLSDRASVKVVCRDVLDYDWDALSRDAGDRGIVVVGNIPYQITSPLLNKLIAHRRSVRRAVIMVQREVARRITARPGGRAFGVLSIAVQVYCRVESLFDVDRGCFRPPPNVDSGVVRLTFDEGPQYHLQNEELFFRLVRGTFKHRRKMLRNGLVLEDRSWPEASRLEGMCGIDLSRRPESLSIEEFDRLRQAIESCSGA